MSPRFFVREHASAQLAVCGLCESLLRLRDDGPAQRGEPSQNLDIQDLRCAYCGSPIPCEEAP